MRTPSDLEINDSNTLLQRLKLNLKDKQKIDLENRYEDEDLRSKRLDNDGKEDYINLRKNWSIYIAVILTFSIIFQMIVALFVGWEILNYEDDQLLINLIMGGEFCADNRPRVCNS